MVITKVSNALSSPSIARSFGVVRTHLNVKSIICMMVALASVMNFAHANPRFMATHGTSYQSSEPDLAVTHYELALVQVLSEICPPMLTANQRIAFTRAYNQQLRSFIPTSASPNDTLRRMHSQRNYRSALNSVRAWTASYPKAQNRKLCLQFAEVEF